MAIKKENKDYIPAVGKRKRAIARIRIIKDNAKGVKITVNDKDYTEYLPYHEWQSLVLRPLKLVGRDNITISIKVAGGGIKGQVDAIKHGIAKALLMTDEELRTTLKKDGLLTRDSRKKERKKPRKQERKKERK